MHLVDVVVIGAGQAGLSAAYHLRRRGFATASEGGDRTFVVLDADDVAGGAWQHRWASLTMATVNGIYELPGMPVPPADPAAASRDVLPPYFAEYERRFALDVQRPVRVRSVRRADDDPDGRILIEADAGTWAARYVINATGTWTRPFVPYVPGARSFRGRQLHVADYRSADEFAGKTVVIVGAGISAIQLLEEISRVASTVWVTRREPVWSEDEFDVPARVAAIAGVEERVRQGLPPGSVISVTGLHWTPWARQAQERGLLERHPMFTAIEPGGVRLPDGTSIAADVILWATGFRAAIDHLAPLKLRTQAGGIRVANGRAIDEPRLFLIGYGPSQSTVGANRAGRDAARAIVADREPVAAWRPVPGRPRRTTRLLGMASTQRKEEPHGGVLSEDSGRAGMWGFLIGIIVAAFIAVPLSASVAFATHPATQQLFGVHLKNASPGGYSAFWWTVSLFLAALPFLIGFGVAKLSGRTLGIIAAIVVAFIAAFVILGQLFLF